MWCATCRADVAGEAAPNNKSLRCATCHSELMSAYKSPASESAKHARELLERWSSEQVLDPYGPLPKATSSSLLDETSEESPEVELSQRPRISSVRIDRPHSGVPDRAGETPGNGNSSPVPPKSPLPQEPSSTRSSLHAAHKPTEAAAPHFDVQRAIADTKTNRKTDWASFFGHMLAYGGVLAMTLGASCVVWGYFGGSEAYAPTGWLMTTAGQMLLFLGIITLVAGGMEQTTNEVARRIDTLGDKLIRIEQATRDHALRGPNFPVEDLKRGVRASSTLESSPLESSSLE